MKIIFHIDVNNAFLSWSALYLLKNGYETDIRNIPSAIGGDEETRHGIILAKSEIAKKYGVKTAETIHSAKLKCHDLQIFPPNYEFYKEQSRKLYEYFQTITPDVERFSIDECFLDLSNTNYLYDDILELAYRIKNEIKTKFLFTVNIGIGNNKLCAKMAGDFSKPDKVHTLFNNEIKAKMWPLPIEDLLFIGKSSSKKLRELNINTIGELATYDEVKLRKYFKNNAKFMIEYANGKDSSKVISKHDTSKSISFSETLIKDTDDIAFLKKKILNMIEKIGISLRKKKLYAQTIALTFKDNNFVSFSHQKKLYNPTNNTMNLYKYAIELFNNVYNHELIRNIGVRVSDLVVSKNTQVSLFNNNELDKENEIIQEVLDNINLKYEDIKIMPAVFYENK